MPPCESQKAGDPRFELGLAGGKRGVLTSKPRRRLLLAALAALDGNGQMGQPPEKGPTILGRCILDAPLWPRTQQHQPQCLASRDGHRIGPQDARD